MHDNTKELTGYPSVDKPWLKTYQSNALNPILPQCTMYELVYERVQNWQEEIALDYFGNRINYKTLINNIKLVAQAFVRRNIQKGDVVTIISPNTPETIYAIYALNCIGAIANLVSATSPLQEIQYFIKETDSKMVLILDKIYSKFKEYDFEIMTIVLPLAKSMSGVAGVVMRASSKHFKNGITYKEFLKGEQVAVKLDGSGGDPAIIIYTSGSTGDPKGVVLSNKNINSCAIQCVVGGKNYQQGEKFLNILPPFISFGIGMLHTSFYVGITNIIVLVPQVEFIQKMLRRHKPERLVIGPAFTDVIENYKGSDLSNLIDLTGGGGAITPEKEDHINDVLREKNANSIYLAGYGMTELSSAVSMNHNDRHKLRSAGLPLTLTNIKILDVNDGHELKYDEEGELLVSSPGLMLCYYNKPEETSKVIEIIDGERWLHTGDLAKVDSEGYLFITGRLKRIYITKTSDGMAYKLFPQRLEEMIESCDGIYKCAVIVVPDDEKQNVPIAFIESSLEKARQVAYDKISTNMPSYYMPQSIIEKPKLPTTPSGKIDYRKLDEYVNCGK